MYYNTYYTQKSYSFALEWVRFLLYSNYRHNNVIINSSKTFETQTKTPTVWGYINKFDISQGQTDQSGFSVDYIERQGSL